MIHTPYRREHFNLFYIIEEDKAAHPLDGDKADLIRRRLLELLSAKNTDEK